jgi:ABC-type amino acid transport substrate-binding protein
MKGKTLFTLFLGSRLAGLGTAVGLAAMLVAVLVFGFHKVSAARASSSGTQTPTQMVQLPAAAKTTLTVATSPDFWPMEYMSGTQIVGHDIDLMNAIATKLSVTVSFTGVAFGDIIAGLVAREYDAAISSLSVTPERDELIDFTLPYVTFMGDDDVAIGLPQGNNALRHQLNEALWQLRTEGTLGTIVANIAADVPEGQPSLPDWPVISPTTESVLVYTDTKQSTTVIRIPRGAVTETTLLAYAAVNTATAPSGFMFAGRAFELDAYQNGMMSPGFTFSVPVTVTMHYSETDLVGMSETTLRLFYRDDNTSRWEDVTTTCVPPSVYDRQPDENSLTIPICHLSKFALFGQHRMYLPLVLGN